jgi:trehalose 6-phosphate synthase/phosphatase
VYIISGRARDELDEWFSSVPRLGLAAEHGFYLRRPGATDWTVLDPDLGFGWKDIVLPILELYTESTDGSSIESKESALVWHYKDADPDFGSWQAKELLDHLEGVLANEPVEVVPGATIVEVKPQGVSKGKAAERILHETQGSEFVLCIGNDRSDEDMFNAMPSKEGSCFACTVGQKPSKAPFYVNDPADVVATLGKLTEVDGGGGGGSGGSGGGGAAPSVSFAT